MVYVSSMLALVFYRFLILFYLSIGTADYIILYAPPGQTGETVFLFDTEPTVDLSNGPNVNSTFSNGTLTLQYILNGSQFVTIEHDNSTLVAVIMDKTVANQWHVPVLPGGESFANYFSIGSNETWISFLIVPTTLFSHFPHRVLIGGPYVVRNASITGGTLFLVSHSLWPYIT